ncbi:hypothetical protein VTO42DRAFT_4074 [Malbranchea cinnamomea]
MGLTPCNSQHFSGSEHRYRADGETDDDVFVVMERIHGQTCEEAGTRLCWCMTLRLAFQLRQFIHRMRAQTSSTAGSLSNGTCRSVWRDDSHGLPSHASPESIAAFICFWLHFVPPSRRKLGRHQVLSIPPEHDSKLPPCPRAPGRALSPGAFLVSSSGTTLPARCLTCSISSQSTLTAPIRRNPPQSYTDEAYRPSLLTQSSYRTTFPVTRRIKRHYFIRCTLDLPSLKRWASKTAPGD